MITLIWLGGIVIASVLYMWQAYSRFSRYGVKHFKVVPPLGNMLEELLRKKHSAELYQKLYNHFPEERFIGKYEFLSPVILLRDLELIKKVTVKDFEHFLDHRMLGDDVVEPIFGRNLFNMRGQEWKDMRSTLSPAFTSSKMRGMLPIMMEVCDQMVESLKEEIKKSGVEYVDVDTKDLTTRYANDVIASCAFGLKVNSHTERDNQFFTIAKKTAYLGFRTVLIFLGYYSFPAIMRKFNVKLFAPAIPQFFRSIVLGTMEERQKKNIIRPDMIHILMEVKKGQLKHEEKPEVKADTGFATTEESHVGKAVHNREWTDDDLVAQAIVFVAAGFDTVSSAMSILLYELALNPDVQERLAQEIRENDAKTGGKFDFDSIQNLTYLDMVVSELMRLWPPGPGPDRICTKDYNLGKPNPKAEKDYIIRKGETVLLSTWSIHHDPEYYPNPYKFDPERFSEENKHKIKPFTYVPFGYGPRNCIGSRFALVETKVMAYQLIKHFEVSPCAKTQIPAELAKGFIGVGIKGGEYARFRIRK